MKLMTIFIFLVFLFLIASICQAKPLEYPETSLVSPISPDDESSFWSNYSFLILSIGIGMVVTLALWIVYFVFINIRNERDQPLAVNNFWLNFKEDDFLETSV